ncbi:RGG repeats nuclear RNA binding protein A-like isoform X2 [Phalaenopsis equestris]|uniref:RGG repeats nuclear RNA binding protein A-like isoform X2 n=1 Tax=Phalaenopsis equestris TaxID=78828 RepID=UPI0009E5D23A|nr:RGG repeats nuclear RNA binding protein A-like isoform X2 [Phalaenopsis equestris]
MSSHSGKLELANHFSALADDDNDDPSHLIASQLQKLSVKKPAPAATVSSAGPPSDLPPPSPAAPAGGGGGRGGGFGRNRYFGNGNNKGRGFERRSGFGRGRGRWGTGTDDLAAQEAEKGGNLHEKAISSEQGQEVNGSREKGEGSNEAERKEPEDKEMTLEEYEKVREEKRKALLSMKVEERKVELDEDLKEMQQLSTKKGNDEVFIKLGSDKEFSKRKENAEKEERGRKAMHIDEFLKPTEGDRRNGLGRGRGRGRGRGSFKGGNNTTNLSDCRAAQAPLAIEDTEQFPALGGK